MATRNSKLKEGNLEKKSRFLGIWRKRWTVLSPNDRNSNHNLSTYKKERVYQSPTEVIRVDSHTNAGATNSVKGAEHRAFVIQNQNGRSVERFLFRAPSREERDEWLQSIKHVQDSCHPSRTNSHFSQCNSDYKEEEKVVPSNNCCPLPLPSNGSSSRHAIPCRDQFMERVSRHSSKGSKAVGNANSAKNIANGSNGSLPPSPYLPSVSTGTFGVYIYPDFSVNEEQDVLPPPEKASVHTELPKAPPFGIKPFGSQEAWTYGHLASAETLLSDTTPLSVDNTKSTKSAGNTNPNVPVEPAPEKQPERETTTNEKPEEVVQGDGQEEHREECMEKEQNVDTATVIKTDDNMNVHSPEKQTEEEVQAEQEEVESNTKLQEELELLMEDAVEPPSPYFPSISTGMFGIYLYPTFSGFSAMKNDDNPPIRVNSIIADEAEEADDNVGDIVDFKDIKAMRTGIVPTDDVATDRESSVSSYRSDGTGPFGDRWGDWNETEEDTKEQTPARTPAANELTPAAVPITPMSPLRMQQNEAQNDDTMEETVDQNAEETKEEETLPVVDTSNMECGNIVVIGGASSGKSTLLQRLLQDDGDGNGDGVYSEGDKVLANDSGDSVLCSFHDVVDVCDLQSTIHAIAMSDIAIIVVSVKEDEFQSSLDSLRDPLRILNTLGVERCICCLSGMEHIDFDQERYQKARDKTEKMIKKIGIKTKKVAFIPVDGGNEKGDNIMIATECMSWYEGWSLKLKKEKRKGMTVADALQTQIEGFASKKGDKLPMVLPVSEVTDDGMICGKIEQGVMSMSGSLMMAMNGESVTVEKMYRSQCVMENAKYGDYVSVKVSGMEKTAIIGDVLYEKRDDFELKTCTKITALVVALSSSTLEVGKFEGVICIRSSVVPCELSKIQWKSSGKNGKVEDAQSLKEKEQGQIELTLKGSMIASTFEQCESLGRFVVLHENQAVLQGKIESLEMEETEDDYY